MELIQGGTKAMPLYAKGDGHYLQLGLRKLASRSTIALMVKPML